MHENMHLFADWESASKHTVVVMTLVCRLTDVCSLLELHLGLKMQKICTQTLK